MTYGKALRGFAIDWDNSDKMYVWWRESDNELIITNQLFNDSPYEYATLYDGEYVWVTSYGNMSELVMRNKGWELLT